VQPVTLGVVATSLLAIVFGVAFWTLLLHVAPEIVGQIEAMVVVTSRV
jgi:hypothetical protein